MAPMSSFKLSLTLCCHIFHVYGWGLPNSYHIMLNEINIAKGSTKGYGSQHSIFLAPPLELQNINMVCVTLFIST